MINVDIQNVFPDLIRSLTFGRHKTPSLFPSPWFPSTEVNLLGTWPVGKITVTIYYLSYTWNITTTATGLVSFTKVLVGEGLDWQCSHVGDFPAVIHPLVQLQRIHYFNICDKTRQIRYRYHTCFFT